MTLTPHQRKEKEALGYDPRRTVGDERDGIPAPFAGSMTLREARDDLRGLVEAGHQCPACSQMARVYRRPINATMAAALIALYKAGPGAHHGPGLPGDTHEISQLAWWGLVADEQVTRPDGGRAGWWSITETGKQFVTGSLMVSRYVHVYDSRVMRRSGKLVGIETCLGDRFSYRELMA